MPTDKHKPLSPFSLRLTEEERAFLGKHAVGMSWADFIRERTFDDTVPIKRTRNKHPVKDHQELAKVLAELGRSRLASNVNQLAKAVHTGSLEVTPDTEHAIQNACGDIRWMRHVLMKALGLQPGKKP